MAACGHTQQSCSPAGRVHATSWLFFSPSSAPALQWSVQIVAACFVAGATSECTSAEGAGPCCTVPVHQPSSANQACGHTYALALQLLPQPPAGQELMHSSSSRKLVDHLHAHVVHVTGAQHPILAQPFHGTPAASDNMIQHCSPVPWTVQSGADPEGRSANLYHVPRSVVVAPERHTRAQNRRQAPGAAAPWQQMLCWWPFHWAQGACPGPHVHAAGVL